MATKIDRRIDDLERAVHDGDWALALDRPEDPLLTIREPLDRSGEKISEIDFREQYPKGLIIHIVRG